MNRFILTFLIILSAMFILGCFGFIFFAIGDYSLNIRIILLIVFLVLFIILSGIGVITLIRIKRISIIHKHRVNILSGKLLDYKENLDERTKSLINQNIRLKNNEEALINFTTELNEQTMSVGKIQKELEEKTRELELKNKQLEDKEEALIRFTTELNEQTMEVGRIEKELDKKSKMLEKLNKKLNVTNEELRKRNEQLIDELEMARRVQENIIPGENKFPKRKELGFGSKYLSMDKIGGDIYDVIKIKDNTYGFLIADVSGHGVPAALITTMAKVSFNTYSHRYKDTAMVCKMVNKDFVELIGDLSYYITAYYGRLDLEKGIFYYTNAGHHSAILYRKKSQDIIELKSEGTIIGAFPFEVKYDMNSIKLEEGDRILLYTDGIIEARSNNNKLYTKKRLIDYVKNNSNRSPKNFVNELIKDVERFCGGRPPEDDRAILYFEFASRMSKDKKAEDSVQIEAIKVRRDERSK